uniref:FHA domain-containing protein n=1 Tax=Anabas testudineus TaxID=64144 RepID=A0AAQ6IGC3_ANATE
MPLHGKIVVIKRSGGDGTEFPLTATCLFGRKPDCDIRIQLPQVSKEHCRIDLNENKEVILTNLSSVNPTRVNGEVLQQSDRLKHGDVITIIDRSFRYPHLKDGTNHDNIQRSLEKTVEVESKEDGSLLQNKTISPFSDLYQMIKKSLDVTTPRKSSASLIQTPSSRFCTPKPGSVRKPVLSTEDKSTHKKDEVVVFSGVNEFKVPADSLTVGTPKSVKKQRKSFQVPTAEIAESTSEKGEHSAKSDTTSPPKRNRVTPQRFTACEVTEQISAQRTKSPVRRSREVTPTKPAVPKKRKSGELAADLPKPQMKRKRVSFGGHLSPELFDKRLPPDSPLRKGATPRRSLCLAKPKVSLLRRASVIGSLKEFDNDGSNVLGLANMRTPSPKKSSVAKNASPKTLTPGNKSPKSKSASPAKKSPASPKSESPARKSPKSKTPSPSATSPGKKSPKSKTPSPKAPSPGKKSPKSKTPSPKATSPGKKSPKSKTPSPKATSPGKKSPKSKTPPPEVNEQPKAQANSIQTPTVQGRFSVSRISTPSPVVEDAVSDKVSSIAITPKIPLRRKSMKSSSRKIQSVTKSAVKVMHRRSGISRASMKVINSWADIVKFGQTKTQVTAPAKKIVTKKAIKKNTPARKLKGHASTGHADSPVTIVVGKAYKQKIVYPTGAAPRAVTNMALFKKDIKMDEDLTGNRPFSFTTNADVLESLGTSVIEPSVLTTPEEPGEMIVSPLSVASTVKGRRYNSEAVQRLLNVDALENNSDCSEQQSTDLKTSPVTTPKQKPGPSECLTGLKRIMKTPRQKVEPVEDIRGRLLVTPKQTIQQQVCLTGVKRLMKTPTSLEADYLNLDGVEEVLQTPAHMQESKDLSEVADMKTPVIKNSPSACLTGIKRIMKTPKEESAPVENRVGVKRLMKTPREKSKPVEDHFGIKRLMKSPRLRGNAPVEDFEGLQELMEESIADSTGHTEINKEVPNGLSSGAVDEDSPVEEPKVDMVENVPEEQPEVENTTVTEINTAVADDDHTKKSLRGRRAKATESKAPEVKQETKENSNDVCPTPVRGRRLKKTETTAPLAVRQTTRNSSKDVELTMNESATQPSKIAVKPKRGRNAKKAKDEAEMQEVQEVTTERESVPEAVSEQCPPVSVDHKANDAPLEKTVTKPRRGRKTKQTEQSQSALEQENVPQANMAEGIILSIFAFMLLIWTLCNMSKCEGILINVFSILGGCMFQ